MQVVSKANAMNMSVMEYRSWEDNRRHLAQYSAAKGGHIHRMSHLGGFGSLNGVFTFGVKFIDLDEDWFPDLILSGDFGTSQMLWNQKNGTYVQGYFDVLEDLMDNSMGCTVGDWDQDGKTDIMFTSVSISSDEMKGLSKVQDGAGMALTFAGNHLYKNLGDRRFRDRTDVAGVRLSGWGWGAFFFDFDNDGDLDVLNGNGMDDPETTDDDVFVNQDMRLYVNQGADENYKYVDEAHERGINDQGDNRGSMSFDYDGDGDLDVFIVNHGEAPALYRNEGGDYNDWLRVKVQESPSRGRRPAIGAKVYVMLRAPSSEAARTGKAANEIMREIKNAAAFCGQNELVAHFGLGKTPLQNGAVHRVRIVWPPMSPGGEPDTVELYQVPIRNVLVVHRPAKDASHRVLTAGATLPICSEKRITQVTAPQHGQAVLDSSKRFVKYRAASGYVGSDEFSYSMTDGLGVTSKARVRVEVAEVQDPQAKLAMKLARPSKHATFNGKHNNVQNVEHNAAAFTRLIRLAPPAYVDGYEEPPGATRPSAREISNVLFAQRESREDPRGLNDLCLHFGQFVAHDVSFVTPLADFYAAGNMAIRVPEGDPTFDPDFTGEAVIRFRRSGADQGTGKDYGVPRQQVNKVTGWLDLSVVYGSGPERADAIKTAKRGKIEMQGDTEDHLAYNSKGLPNLNLLGKRVERLVVSGDNRVNVQPGLLTLHTLWAREHNRVANQLLIDSPTMTDREIFMAARRQTISTYQQVVMYEYLPAILGWKSMHELGVISTEEVPSEYIPTTDARVSNEFASVAFRFGHSQVTDTLHRFDADLKASEHGHLHLRDNYFSPGRVLKQGGLDPILRGMIRTACQAVDTKAMDGVRNFLFGTNTKGFDLAAINIQRGRDHGILDYNSLRRELGLAPRQNFTDITSDSDVASKLAKLYSSVDDIDAFVGGLAEDHVEGGAVGELFAWIIGNQFRRLRSGDRLWFEHGKLPSEQRLTRLSDVIKRNSGLNDDDAVWQDVKNSFFVPGKRNPRPFIRRTEL